MINIDNYNKPEYSINDSKGIIIGESEIMLNLFHYLNHLAKLPTTVLLRGDSGTGKELCAKALHYNADDTRKENNFVAVNCAGIPSELLETELFGYVKGAFTGAYKTSQGKFQHAQGGTILLDEIADMKPMLQAKVLRVLQEKQITRVGSNEVEEINVRIIAATNKNLEEEVLKGTFREDLYYRLNVVPVKVPSLSKRREDIPLIAEYFIKKYNGVYGFKLDKLSNSAKDKLKRASWKGNVRELENIIERVFVLKKEGIINSKDLCFNSDIPIKIINQQTKLIKEKGEFWYQNGVLPVPSSYFSNIEGSKSYPTIVKIADNENIFTTRLNLGETRSNRLIYLTLENIDLFFNNTSTQHYENLRELIQYNPFMEVINQPFSFFNISNLVNNPYTLKTPLAIKKAANKANAYTLSIGSSKCYALTLTNSHYFLSRKPSNNQGIEDLHNIINDSYKRFKNWSNSLIT